MATFRSTGHTVFRDGDPAIPDIEAEKRGVPPSVPRGGRRPSRRSLKGYGIVAGMLLVFSRWGYGPAVGGRYEIDEALAKGLREEADRRGLTEREVLEEAVRAFLRRRAIEGTGTVEYEDIEKSRRNRDHLKREYRRSFGELSRLLASHDPIGLVGLGAPDDEYEPEAGTILSRPGAVSSKEEALDVVHEEFVRWFGPEVAGPKEVYEETASGVWRIRRRHDRG